VIGDLILPLTLDTLNAVLEFGSSAWNWVKSSLLLENDDEITDKKNITKNQKEKEKEWDIEEGEQTVKPKMKLRILNNSNRKGSEFTSFLLSLIPVQYFSTDVFLTSVKTQFSWEIIKREIEPLGNDKTSLLIPSLFSQIPGSFSSLKSKTLPLVSQKKFTSSTQESNILFPKSQKLDISSSTLPEFNPLPSHFTSSSSPTSLLSSTESLTLHSIPFFMIDINHIHLAAAFVNDVNSSDDFDLQSQSLTLLTSEERDKIMAERKNYPIVLISPSSSRSFISRNNSEREEKGNI
jgi:hypothetical protein